jgi:hypothetical protein
MIRHSQAGQQSGIAMHNYTDGLPVNSMTVTFPYPTNFKWGDRISTIDSPSDIYICGVISPTQYEVVIVTKPKRKSLIDRIRTWFGGL